MVKLKWATLAVVIFVAALLPATANANIVRSVKADGSPGNTFTAVPVYCSCWTTQSGYVFNGIPFSDAQRDGFLAYLHLGKDVPTVFGGPGETGWRNGLMDELRADPSFDPNLAPVTSGSVSVVITGTVEEDSE